MRLFVPLTREEFGALLRLARAERRRPQDQVAVLLSRALGAEPVRAHRLAPQRPPTSNPANASIGSEEETGAGSA